MLHGSRREPQMSEAVFILALHPWRRSAAHVVGHMGARIGQIRVLV